jgi:hypothetical protein
VRQLFPSCGTVALYGPFYLFIFFADHRATVFTLSKTFETAQKKSCAAFSMKATFRKRNLKKTFIYSDYLLKNICQEDPNSHFSLYKTAENIFGKM